MPDLAPGATFAEYRIEGVLGRGGMGLVYRATQLALERQVALKVIAGTASDPAFRDRFRHEALAAAAIDHPNVLPVFDAGEHDGVLFLSMRLVEGETLADRLRRDGRLEPGQAVALATQVAAALDAAHARGVVHRDVKPANVLIAADDHAYLADFGIARLSGREGLTETGVVVGTLGYVAPEVLRGDAADGRSDAYALGCVLYQTLTGTAPYPRGTEAATLAAHLFDPVPSVRDRVKDVSPALDALVRSLLAKEPDERPRELTLALRGAERHPPRVTWPRRGARLIGRDGDLRDVIAACGSERLVTLTGPAGVGKTELALAAAERLAPDFRDGVFWVPLEALAEEVELVPAIARALALSDEPGVEPLDRVIAHARERRMLLVLDNFEHVIGAATALPPMLTGAPGLHLLLTSQAPLRVRDERVLPVPALELPSAVRMLRDRAPDPAITEDDAVIAEICRRLDALPLALELAAARLAVLTPAELLERLDRSLDALGTGRRDAPDRHRGLRAALDWTTSQLTPRDRALLGRLAVFAGGFTVDLAEAVGDGDVVDGLAALRDVSLLRRDADGRLSLPPPVRLYALERLTDDGARSRHAEAILELAQREDWVADLLGGVQVIRAEADNLRQALRWTRAERPGVHAQLVAAAAQLLAQAGYEREVVPEVEAALERTDDPGLRARLLLQRAFLLEGTGDPEPFRGAVKACREAGEDRSCVEALCGLANVLAQRDEGEPAHAAAAEAQALAARLGQPACEHMAMGMLGQALRVCGRLDEAMATLYAVEQRAGPRSASGLGARTILADAALDAGNATTALSRYARALGAFYEAGMLPTCAFQLDGAAMALAALGRHEDAYTAAMIGDRLRYESSIEVAPDWRRRRDEALAASADALTPAARESCRIRVDSSGTAGSVAWVAALADGQSASV